MAGTEWFTDPRYAAGLEELARLDAQEAAVLAARSRVLAHLAARTSREDRQAESPFDSLVLDVAGTSLLGQVAAGSHLVDAEHLVVRLPGTLAALESGALRAHQAQVLVEQTRALPPASCAVVERRVLEQAHTLCPSDLRRVVKRVVLEVDAEAVTRREARARRARRTWVRPAEDGMALLCALLPAEQAQAALGGLTEQARHLRGDGDERCLDQLRADLLVAACASTPAPAPGATRDGGRRRRPWRPVRVVVHVPLAVAQGLSDAPADLEGHGPISAAHARRLLVDAELQRACADPDTGEVWALDDGAPAAGRAGRGDGRPGPPEGDSDSLATAIDRRRAVDALLTELARRPPPAPPPPELQHDPSAALARLVRTRDARCDGPGCSVPAGRCELDHEVPWPQGPTSAENLATRSQRCHHAKHAGWSVDRSSEASTWTSPGGRRYVVPHRRGLPRAHTAVAGRTARATALAEGGFLLLRVHDLLLEQEAEDLHALVAMVGPADAAPSVASAEVAPPVASVSSATPATPDPSPAGADEDEPPF